MTQVLERIDDVRARLDRARDQGLSVGFVPTMGFFHEGHLTLMRNARRAHDVVIVSLFVNPLQFGPTEDLSVYPRDFDRDLEMARSVGVDILFAPSVDEMYPQPIRTTVHLSELTDGLCGRSRPGHFDGVATVVTKLFSIVGRSTAYFGKKDFQQLAVIRRMVADLNLDVQIVGCPIVRERDGLAMSSRNVNLSAANRQAALVLSTSLRAAVQRVVDGERDASVLHASITAAIAAVPATAIDYVEIVDGSTLAPVEHLADGTETLMAVAVRFGDDGAPRVRLIDNVTVTAVVGRRPRVQFDLGTSADGSPCRLS